MRPPAAPPSGLVHDDVFRRLCRARELIHDAHAEPLALEVGFASLGSFSALFSREVGCSPRDYQRRVRALVRVPERLPLLVVPHCYFAWFGSDPRA